MKTLRNSALILIAVSAMAAVIWTVGEKLRTQQNTQSTPALLVPKPAATYQRPSPATETIGDTQHLPRTLATYYERRAYPGAPPAIPHTLVNAENCTTCHEKGGFVAPFNAWTPISPHPHYASCTQCHVPQAEVAQFAATGFLAAPAPAIKRPALPGGPPPIPHTLQLRTDCAACHVGPAAPLAIRTSHPERTNCVQCHVPSAGERF